MSKIVAAALLFASSALAQCNAGVERFAGECSCNSGFIGPVCDDNAGTLCNFPNAAPLRTEAVAELDALASGVSENTLNLRIKGFPATDRYFSRMDVNSDNENCRYPGPNAVKSFEACTDIFDIGIPISELINNCSFAVDPEGAFTTLTGDIIVAAVDQLGEFRGTPIVRETKSALSFSVSLPNTVTVNSSALQVFSEIEIMAAVVLQEFERSNDLVSVELFTSVQFPYTLSPVNIVPPAGLEDYLTWEPMVPCVNTNGAPCEQNLAFNLVNLTAASICDFSGIYTINVTYYCQEVDDCPVEGAPVASIELDLNSGNICEGNVVINGELDGSLTSYGNPEHSGEEKIIFTAGETVYMLLELTSSIEIESIDLDVVVVVDGEEINISSNPQLYGYNEVELNPGEKGFYFVASYGDKVANPDLLFGLDEQQATPFYVTANVLVTYKTSFGRKREINQSSFSLSAQSILLH